MASKRVNREEWRKRVERWKESGLTAEQFATEMGINAGTLQVWRYKLRKQDERSARRQPVKATSAIVSSLVEVRPSAGVVAEALFEIELANGRRVRVPASFEPSALKSLLAVLEAAR